MLLEANARDVNAEVSGVGVTNPNGNRKYPPPTVNDPKLAGATDDGLIRKFQFGRNSD